MPFECPNCGNTFNVFSRLKKHMLSQHDAENTFHCSECDVVVKESTRVKFQCEVCTKQFMNRSQLDVHMSMHTREKRFRCSHCGEAFSRKRCLTMHLMTHSSEDKPYQCGDCGVRFRIFYNLRRHILLKHVKPKKLFYCKICNAEFESSVHLLSHKVPDTGEKPYKCSECDLRFRQLGHLQTHALSCHSTIKHYLCNVCGKAFNRNSNFKRHLTIHRQSGTERTAYKCDDCGKAYFEKANLRRHWITSHRRSGKRKKREENALNVSLSRKRRQEDVLNVSMSENERREENVLKVSLRENERREENVLKVSLRENERREENMLKESMSENERREENVLKVSLRENERREENVLKVSPREKKEERRMC